MSDSGNLTGARTNGNIIGATGAHLTDPCCEDIENDADADGVCESDEIVGCQDDTACDYNENATDAGDCTYVDGVCETCSGETDGTGTVVDND